MVIIYGCGGWGVAAGGVVAVRGCILFKRFQFSTIIDVCFSLVYYFSVTDCGVSFIVIRIRLHSPGADSREGCWVSHLVLYAYAWIIHTLVCVADGG
jgi:hypothetical protein